MGESSEKSYVAKGNAEGTIENSGVERCTLKQNTLHASTS